MPTTLKSLVVFGDSMSDLGRKRSSGFGRMGRLLGAMRVNEIGRFSDRKNWADFVWEWAGGRSMVERDKDTTNANTALHLSINRESNTDSGFGRPFHFAVYAEGGAMGASDRSGTGLGTFKDQVGWYLADLVTMQRGGAILDIDPALYIIFFGLNDLVTNKRPPLTMNVVVHEMVTLANKIRLTRPNCHFMFLTLPAPSSAVRYKDKVGSLEVGLLDQGVGVFNAEFKKKIVTEAVLPNAGVLDLGAKLAGIDADLPGFGFIREAQAKGTTIDYGTTVGPLELPSASYATTSDAAHPTEAMYKVMAKFIARGIIARELELGSLSRSFHTRSEPRARPRPTGIIPRLSPPPH